MWRKDDDPMDRLCNFVFFVVTRDQGSRGVEPYFLFPPQAIISTTAAAKNKAMLTTSTTPV